MNAAQHAGYLGAGGRAGETSLFFLCSSPTLRSVSVLSDMYTETLLTRAVQGKLEAFGTDLNRSRLALLRPARCTGTG